MPNETIMKFGYPDSLVHEYDHWVVLLRPAQVTIGSLVLANKEEVVSFPELSRDSFAELREVAGHLETALGSAYGCDKINYLMLMMVDPHVHYHVIPRYAAPVRLRQRDYPDELSPGPPDVTRALDLAEGQLADIRENLREHWPA